MTEAANGTCGPITDQIFNVGSQTGPDADNNQTGLDIECESGSNDGCYVQQNRCTYKTETGAECRYTMAVDYAADGSKGGGVYSIECRLGTTYCSSTYSIQVTRY
jgi:hypothetical protein